MKRGLAAVGLSVMAVAAVHAIPSSADAKRSNRVQPNILVIMVDDARYDDLAAMPQTRDQLVGSIGTRYNDCHASNPVCSPSRATLLTGQYSHHHGVWDNEQVAGQGWAAFEDNEAQALPVVMQQAGYETSFIGKYMNGYPGPEHVPLGWDRWAGQFGGSTYNYFHTDVVIGRGGEYVETQEVDANYVPLNMAGRARAQIRERGQGTPPLFMWLSIVAPHTSGSNGVIPQPEQYKGWSTIGAPESEAFNEPNVDDKPPWIQALPRLDEQQIDEVITKRQNRRNALRAVDDSVAAIVDELRAIQQLGDTVIIFTSDNGMLLREHRIGNKRAAYTESTHVPLLIRGANYGFEPGIRNYPVSNIDLGPTIAALAGTELPEADGVDIRTLSDPARPLLIEGAGLESLEMPAYHAVRQNDALYVRSEDGFTELYDALDPDQRWNVSGDPNHAVQELELQAELEALEAS